MTVISNTRRSTRISLVAALLATFFSLLTLLGAQPASAAVAQYVSGSTGSVSLNGPLTHGRDQTVYNGPCCSYYVRSFSTAGVTVSRASSYAGSQRVTGNYQLERWVNGAWQFVQRTNSWSGVISGTGRLTFPAYNFANPPQYTGQFPYRIAVGLVWTNASTGAAVGSERIVSSYGSENRCTTSWIRCTVYSDSVVM